MIAHWTAGAGAAQEVLEYYTDPFEIEGQKRRALWDRLPSLVPAGLSRSNLGWWHDKITYRGIVQVPIVPELVIPLARVTLMEQMPPILKSAIQVWSRDGLDLATVKQAACGWGAALESSDDRRIVETAHSLLDATGVAP